MRTALGLAGRVLTTALIFAWWSVGVAFMFGSGDFRASALIYIVPLEAVGLLLAWKVADPDRY